MLTPHEIENQLSFLDKGLVEKILAASVVKDFSAGTEIIREGQYIKTIPLLLRGLVKLSIRQDDKELLLYYMEPSQSCVMSFYTSLSAEKSKAFAIAELDSTILLIPSTKVQEWIREYPRLSQLFYSQFELRYLDLLETVNQLVFDRLDKRILKYLNEQAKISGKDLLPLSHRKIAGDLGSTREVVTRAIKKLEAENKVRQLKRGIRIL